MVLNGDVREAQTSEFEEIQQPTSTAVGFATPVEAASFLRLSKAMIHKLIGEGKIPASRATRVGGDV